MVLLAEAAPLCHTLPMRHSQRRQTCNGFTLIELLLIIGVIAILASIVIIAVNPQKQLLAAADASRQRHAEELKNAMSQYYIDAGLPANIGSISTSMGDYTPVCKQGTTANGCVNVDYIAPVYIPTVPQDSNEPCTSGSIQLSGFGISYEGAKFQAGSLGLGVAKPSCIAPNLVGWWQLGSVSNALATPDSSGNGLAGTLINPDGSTAVPGKLGRALSLNGLNEFVSVPDTAALKYSGANMSVSLWMYPAATEAGSAILVSKPWNGVGQYNYFLYVIPSSSYVAFCVAGQCVNVYGVGAIGKWSHITGTIDAARVMKLYVNGVLQATAQNTASFTPSSGDSNLPLVVGSFFPYAQGWAGNVDYSFDGLIDDVRIYNAALTADQVKQVMAGGT